VLFENRISNECNIQWLRLIVRVIWICLLLLCYLWATSVNILSSFSLYWHYKFRPNQPPSGVKVVLIKESSAHCKAVLFLLCSCLRLLLVMWVNQLFYLGVLELHVFALWFRWFVVCGYLEYSCWGGSVLYGGGPLRSFVHVQFKDTRIKQMVNPHKQKYSEATA
jgi:hypothetical protein